MTRTTEEWSRRRPSNTPRTDMTGPCSPIWAYLQREKESEECDSIHLIEAIEKTKHLIEASGQDSAIIAYQQGRVDLINELLAYFSEQREQQGNGATGEQGLN